MSWLSSTINKLLNKDSFKLILKIGEKLLKMIAGKIGSDLQKIALEEVRNAEASGFDGAKKYEMAYKSIKARLIGSEHIKEYAINLAIETAVAAINELKG